MRFAVIEGLDGSGKSTQVDLLRNYLEDNKIDYKYIHFPRTDAPVYGELIARFLRGEMGDIQNVDPYLVALIYAGDRYEAREMINNWIRDDLFVLVDRYVISNIAFQCAKLNVPEEINKLKDWILEMEFDHNKLPVPDINIFLDVPFEFTLQQLTGTREGNDRDYLNGNSDIHEKNLEFQKRVRNVYLSLQNEMPGFKILNCYDEKGLMLNPETIFNQIKKILFKK